MDEEESGVEAEGTVRKQWKCRVGVVEPVSVVRDLGVWIDAELSLRDQISRTTRACYLHLRRLRSIRTLLGRDVTVQLVSTIAVGLL